METSCMSKSSNVEKSFILCVFTRGAFKSRSFFVVSIFKMLTRFCFISKSHFQFCRAAVGEQKQIKTTPALWMQMHSVSFFLRALVSLSSSSAGNAAPTTKREQRRHRATERAHIKHHRHPPALTPTAEQEAHEKLQQFCLLLLVHRLLINCIHPIISDSSDNVQSQTTTVQQKNDYYYL